MSPFSTRLVTLLSLLTLAYHRRVDAKVYQDASELDPDAKFDFIVVGSGPGGAPIASRLSEDPRFNVLLIEAGGNNGLDVLRIPAYYNRMPATYKWNYTTTPNPATNNRTLGYNRGYVLGGSSSIHAMIYTRASADDYDSYASISGDPGWRWDAMIPYFKKHERLVPPAGGRNASGEYDPSVHGTEGKMFVSPPTYGPSDFDYRTLNVTTQQPEFPFLLDQSNGHPNGVAFMQFTIGNGERSSAATAYLDLTARERPNFSILLNTYVTRVLPAGGQDASEGLLLRTVEFGDKSSRKVLGNLTATKEVVLSAGVIGTPQILLNSGIGNKTELEAVGVKAIHDLPDVGKNMHDHIAPPQLTWSASVQDSSPSQTDALAEWNQNKTGPLTVSVANRLLLWSRIPDNSSIWQQFPKREGSDKPDFEIYLGAQGFTPGSGSVSARIVLLTPRSRGSVTLRSSNPFDDPRIDPGVLRDPFDVAALKEGYRIVKRFFTGPQWKDYLSRPSFSDPDTTTDAAWERTLRSTVSHDQHGVGTAAMSEVGAKEGVVDPDLKVKGVSGIRVVDASVIPHLPAGHTQVPIYVFAERAADLIKASWDVESQR